MVIGAVVELGYSVAAETGGSGLPVMLPRYILTAHLEE
jgi:hypothetical protein